METISSPNVKDLKRIFESTDSTTGTSTASPRRYSASGALGGGGGMVVVGSPPLSSSPILRNPKTAATTTAKSAVAEAGSDATTNNSGGGTLGWSSTGLLSESFAQALGMDPKTHCCLRHPTCPLVVTTSTTTDTSSTNTDKCSTTTTHKKIVPCRICASELELAEQQMPQNGGDGLAYPQARHQRKSLAPSIQAIQEIHQTSEWSAFKRNHWGSAVITESTSSQPSTEGGETTTTMTTQPTNSHTEESTTTTPTLGLVVDPLEFVQQALLRSQQLHDWEWMEQKDLIQRLQAQLVEKDATIQELSSKIEKQQHTIENELRMIKTIARRRAKHNGGGGGGSGRRGSMDTTATTNTNTNPAQAQAQVEAPPRLPGRKTSSDAMAALQSEGNNTSSPSLNGKTTLKQDVSPPTPPTASPSPATSLQHKHPSVAMSALTVSDASSAEEEMLALKGRPLESLANTASKPVMPTRQNTQEPVVLEEHAAASNHSPYAAASSTPPVMPMRQNTQEPAVLEEVANRGQQLQSPQQAPVPPKRWESREQKLPPSSSAGPVAAGPTHSFLTNSSTQDSLDTGAAKIVLSDDDDDDEDYLHDSLDDVVTMETFPKDDGGYENQEKEGGDIDAPLDSSTAAGVAAAANSSNDQEGEEYDDQDDYDDDAQSDGPVLTVQSDEPVLSVGSSEAPVRSVQSDEPFLDLDLEKDDDPDSSDEDEDDSVRDHSPLQRKFSNQGGIVKPYTTRTESYNLYMQAEQDEGAGQGLTRQPSKEIAFNPLESRATPTVAGTPNRDHSLKLKNEPSEEDIKFIEARQAARERLAAGVKVKKRRYRFKEYKDCFIGSEAVNYMVSIGWAKSRDQAVKIGRSLQEQYNLFEHVVDPEKHAFEDKYLFYKFNEFDPNDASRNPKGKNTRTRSLVPSNQGSEKFDGHATAPVGSFEIQFDGGAHLMDQSPVPSLNEHKFDDTNQLLIEASQALNSDALPTPSGSKLRRSLLKKGQTEVSPIHGGGSKRRFSISKTEKNSKYQVPAAVAESPGSQTSRNSYSVPHQKANRRGSSSSRRGGSRTSHRGSASHINNSSHKATSSNASNLTPLERHLANQSATNSVNPTVSRQSSLQSGSQRKTQPVRPYVPPTAGSSSLNSSNHNSVPVRAESPKPYPVEEEKPAYQQQDEDEDDGEEYGELDEYGDYFDDNAAPLKRGDYLEVQRSFNLSPVSALTTGSYLKEQAMARHFEDNEIVPRKALQNAVTKRLPMEDAFDSEDEETMAPDPDKKREKAPPKVTRKASNRPSDHERFQQSTGTMSEPSLALTAIFNGSVSNHESIGVSLPQPKAQPAAAASQGQQQQRSSKRSSKPVKRVNGETVSDKYGDEGMYTGSVALESELPHGYGEMKYDNGRQYAGEWKGGRWHGFGRWANPNGDVYEGTFDYDARHGRGVYTWKNGNVYRGEFYEDKRQGKGTFHFANGNEFVGDFVNGVFDGSGKYSFEGGEYNGSWKNGRYHGHGVLLFADGTSYKGQFADGVAHGKGEETTADGNTRRGVWEQGRPL